MANRINTIKAWHLENNSSQSAKYLSISMKLNSNRLGGKTKSHSGNKPTPRCLINMLYQNHIKTLPTVWLQEEWILISLDCEKCLPDSEVTLILVLKKLNGSIFLWRRVDVLKGSEKVHTNLHKYVFHISLPEWRENRRLEISENFWSLLVFLDLTRGGSTKNHTGKANAFFPLFLPK